MIEKLTIDIHLSIEIKNDDVIAYVRFHNNTSVVVYLDTWTICVDDIFSRNIFSIYDENDKHVLYTGMMAYRHVVPEDFIGLNPSESIMTKITVNNGYKLIKGHKYSIRFCANNPTYLDKQKLDLWSNKVEITY